MSDKLSELQKELENNLYKATVIAEENTKRNEMGQVVISEDECQWDAIADIFNNAIKKERFNKRTGSGHNRKYQAGDKGVIICI